MRISVTSLDHLVLTVADISASVDFYTTVMGMEHRTSAAGRHSLHFGDSKINLHQQGKEFQPHARHPAPGSADLCFLSDTPMDELGNHLEHCSVRIVAGPVRRTGAAGELLSIYFRDPDGNLIEVANPVSSGFSNSTPCKETDNAA
jgi:catechol 2,3-dioxygenase-like lactoylglutathione lyase family enzyme